MRNIIITGGELFNKGAQAMTFVAVHELKKRFPDHEIYLLSEMDLRRPEQERAQYAFGFTGWYPVKFAHAQSNGPLRLSCLLRSGKELRACETLYRNCDLMVDVSGYGLGSNFGPNQLNTYADHLEFAKAFHIPMVLMPQSFGPFDFQGEKAAAGKRFTELLSSVKLICAREPEGMEALIQRYNLINVCLLPDLVLNNRELSLDSIYRIPPKMDLPVIPENCVGLVPNQRIVEAIGQDAALDLYTSAVNAVLQNGKSLRILSHASADRKICGALKDRFLNEELVGLLENDFNCLEFHELAKQFQFLIASRFHSVVHAYKNGVPCIAIGWAVKYQKLLESFGQERFSFDVRDTINGTTLLKAVEDMCLCWPEESARIGGKLRELQEKNVFDVLDGII